MFAKLPESNPLAKYKRSDVHMSWTEISAVTGLTVNGLIRIAKIEDKTQFGNITIATNHALKKIGIDLTEYYIETDEPIVNDNLVSAGE